MNLLNATIEELNSYKNLATDSGHLNLIKRLKEEIAQKKEDLFVSSHTSADTLFKERENIRGQMYILTEIDRIGDIADAELKKRTKSD